MGTTALIVEMVIIGFQVVVWMSLIILVIVGYDWIDVSKFKDWATPISIALVGVSYTLGIIFDSFIRLLFITLEPASPGNMMAYIIATNTDAAEELNKRANRSSLVRATSLNLLIISVSSLIFVKKYFGWSIRILTLIVVFSILLTGLALLTWFRSVSGYNYYVREVYEALKQSEKSKSNDN